MINFAQFLEYIDLYGTKPGFYIDRKAKFYTVVGGIFSLSALAICFVVFIIFSLDELKREVPSITTTSSTLQQNIFQPVNFKEEKIYIPWRIVNNENRFINHTGLLYPEIGSFISKKTNRSNLFEHQFIKLNYTLCNKTSMKNIPENFYIPVSLDELYCIETDNIKTDGLSYIEHIQFIMYLCEDQISYDPNNSKCTNHEKLVQTIKESNSLSIEFYYPNVQFQPTNLTHPIIISYKKHYYNFNQNFNKIERFYIKNHILKEDLGMVFKEVKKSSYWGFDRLESDYYLTFEKDLFNDKIITSQVYTSFIFFDSTIILYTRKYKKIMAIIVEGLPVMYVVFIIFGWIAKIFKLAEETKIMMELLFENLKEKPNNIKMYLQNAIKEMDEKALVSGENNNNNSNNNNNNNFNSSDSNINHIEISKFPRRFSVINQTPLQNALAKYKKSDGSIFKNNFSLYRNMANERAPSVKLIQKMQKNYVNKNYFVTSSKKKYVTVLLFPYRYYLYSVFIKNTSIIKDRPCCFSRKFLNVYKYLTQIIDITTYLSLQREFHIFKTEILDAQKLNMIEHQRKINVNDNYFYSKIKINQNEEK